jgi:hypothetical protein
MAEEEWIKTLKDGRKVKFIYQELPEDGAFITAQLERHEVVYFCRPVSPLRMCQRCWATRTQKHYSPWVQSRQDALDRAVKTALEAPKSQPLQ